MTSNYAAEVAIHCFVLNCGKIAWHVNNDVTYSYRNPVPRNPNLIPLPNDSFTDLQPAVAPALVVTFPGAEYEPPWVLSPSFRKLCREASAPQTWVVTSI